MTTQAESSALHKCVRTIHHDGILTLCVKTVKRLGESVLQTNSADWFRADLSQVHQAPAPSAEARVDFNAMEDVVSWLKQIRTEFTWVWVEAELEAARAHDHVFALLRLGTEAAGYVKIGFTRAYVTDFQQCIVVPSASAYIYDTFVHPKYRRRGLATFAILQTLDFLQERNVRFVWCHIPTWNSPSIKAYVRSGFSRVRHVRYARLLGCRLFTCNPERLMQRSEEVCLRGP